MAPAALPQLEPPPPAGTHTGTTAGAGSGAPAAAAAGFLNFSSIALAGLLLCTLLLRHAHARPLHLIAALERPG
jgi:hypothetical protein